MVWPNDADRRQAFEWINVYEVAPDLRGHKGAGRVVGIQVIQKIQT
jgi:hypothetical protein